MTTVQQFAWVAAGGGLGASARFAFNLWLGRFSMPLATFAVNVLGCIALGFLVHWFAVRDFAWWQDSGRLLLATGFCGAFTTMSALALEVSVLADKGQSGLAIGFALATLVASCIGLLGGISLARATLGA
ncbi:MAG: fluoride efflux transporter CrcB [Pseudomonadota bacterium]